MIISKKNGQKKVLLREYQKNSIKWSFVLCSAIIVFLVSVVLAGVGFLANILLFFDATDSTNTTLSQALLTWLLPVLVLCGTLLLVHKNVSHNKWLHTTGVFLLLLILWLCLFWLIAVF
ncbi:MAG: hypothetical protein Q7K43_01375 [Candidatus Woesearchaeota archaeon]|nr:hypothetical protein [Candidatus Woesearchaeota archaeon]